MSVSNMVPCLKNNLGFDYNTCMKYKNTMMSQLNYQIEQCVANNGAYQAKSYSRWWTDGRSGWAFVYYFHVLPRQEVVLIYDVRGCTVNQLKERKQRKRVIKLKESDLRRIISESIDEMLNEYCDSRFWGWDY